MPVDPSGAQKAEGGKANDKEYVQSLDQEGLMQSLFVNLHAHEELLLQRLGALIDQKFRDHFALLDRHLAFRDATAIARVMGTADAQSPRGPLEFSGYPRPPSHSEQMPTMRMATAPSAPLKGDSHAAPPEPELNCMRENTDERSVKFGQADGGMSAPADELVGSGISVPPATLAMKEAAAKNFSAKGVKHAMISDGAMPKVDDYTRTSHHSDASSATSHRWTVINTARASTRERRSMYRMDGLELAKGWFKEKQHGFLFEDDEDSSVEMDQLSPFERRARALVHKPELLYGIFLGLFCHAVFLGLQAQWTLDISLNRVYGRSPDLEWQGPLLLCVNAFFLILYIIEMLLRAYVQKSNYFLGPDWSWNLFHCVITFLDFIGLLIQAGMAPLEQPDVGFMIGQCARSIRFLRIFEVIRSVQHEFFHEVRLIILSISGSLSAFLWAFLLMMVLMFIAGILTLQGVMNYLWNSDVDLRSPINATATGDGAGDSAIMQYGKLSRTETVLALEKYYGSVLQVMITLFQAISGGMDWQEGLLPLYETAWSYKIWFSLFVAISFCWILNVLTGVFVNVAMRRWQVDSDTAVQLELRRNETYVKAIKSAFNDLDSDQSGTINLEELEEHLKNPRVQAYFQNLELDISEARGLFTLLDTEERNEVDIEEFCVGCMRLKGTAKSIDVATLLYENKKVMMKICSNNQFMEDAFGELFQVLDGVNSKLLIMTSSSTI